MEPQGGNNRRLGLYIAMILLNCVASLVIRGPEARADYRSFYAAGRAAGEPSQVYDLASQYRAQISLFGSFNPFNHLPLEIAVFAPLSHLPYLYSLWVWRGLSLLCLAASGALLAKATATDTTTMIAVLASIFPVAICIELGQDSLLLLLFVSAAFYLLRRNSDILAGVALSFALFKPQLPIILAFALLCARRTKFCAAFATSTAAIAAASVLYLGKAGIEKMLLCIRVSETSIPIAVMPTLRGLMARLAGDHEQLAIFILVAMVLTFIPLWRRFASLEFVFATAICLYGVCAIHLYAHDLVLLGIPVAFLLGTPKRAYDNPLLAILMSAPLYVALFILNLATLAAIPTMLLGARCLLFPRDAYASPAETALPEAIRA